MAHDLFARGTGLGSMSPETDSKEVVFHIKKVFHRVWGCLCRREDEI